MHRNRHTRSMTDAILIALDQGTTSSRTVAFTPDGHVLAQAQREFAQHFPRTGWVEHDPTEIWASQRDTFNHVLEQLGERRRHIRAVGITNQRETTILWDRKTGQPVAPALVWQDRRGEPWCARQRNAGLEDRVRDITGLRLDAYFSASKIAWLLDNIPGARARAERGELAFGTVDTWLLWQLTAGQVHRTDISNASRTLVFDIRRGSWSDELLGAFGIPASLLPDVLPSVAHFGEVSNPELALAQGLPIGGMAGDQQAALVGQLGTRPGRVKNTYGTGCFMLMNTGSAPVRSGHGLLATCAAGSNTFALEGSVFVGGAVVQWLRDGLGFFDSSAEIESLAASVPDAGGVIMVPALTGLGAPYWAPDARGAIYGLSRGTNRAHLARAALEAIAFQSAALLQAMSRDLQDAGLAAPTELRVDGGASRNDLLMQFQADLLGMPVLRPKVTETTALGAAWLAALGVGVLRDINELEPLWYIERRFDPQTDAAWAQERMAAWETAVRRTTLESGASA